MTNKKSFNGPWASSLPTFARTISEMPDIYRTSFDTISTSSAAVITNKAYLHVWESDSDIDALLHLTQVVVKIRSLTNYIPSPTGIGQLAPAGMLIIAQASESIDHYSRICALVAHHTGSVGKSHLKGAAMAFGTIAVVKGVDNSHKPTQDVLDRAVERVNKAINRVFDKCSYNEKKIVWHNGPIVLFVAHWISKTTSTLRSSLAALTIHSVFQINSKSIIPTSQGLKNRIEDLERIETFCNRLGIFAVFLDTSSQLIEKDYLSGYMYYYAFYIHLYLTPSLIRPHFFLANDQLITFAFRVYAACNKNYTEAVTTVKSQLPSDKAKTWARKCIDPSSYPKKDCRKAIEDDNLCAVVHLADTPLRPFTPGLPRAFSRLTVGPTAPLLAEHYVCAPISLSLNTNPIQIRASAPSGFRLWIPKPDQDQDKITQRIQGIMLGVLEIILREKGMPKIDDKSEEAEMWKAVVKAVAWALKGCKDKLPHGVEDKLECVKKALGGSWSFNLWGVQG
ncbi:hypothetical protein B0J11DRAFT_495788 [Dendryphion nanum]|uniref:Uncharacterized protein n=1 Tax=Dendryphion nanum TaxID=256645 RepID=A0A9P9D919_9PLEO|nr:hypothetical protein B0J11DRAFT_495788 [Dendryphion nanum]